MQLTLSNSSDLIAEVARQTGQSKDKSLFSLLLQLEEHLCEEPFENRVSKSEMSTILDPGASLLATSTRYIE